MFISFKGVERVTFINDGIQYQMPCLIAVVVFKYVILVVRKFKTSKKLFYYNLAIYCIFLVVVVLLDYEVELFGTAAEKAAHIHVRAKTVLNKISKPTGK